MYHRKAVVPCELIYDMTGDMLQMNLSKSIDFLLENAGVVIQYRLRKEILKNISATEEEKIAFAMASIARVFALLKAWLYTLSVVMGVLCPNAA